MAAELAHFAIHADDVDRAKRFYQAVFAWNAASYPGFDDFVQLTGEDGRPFGAIEARRYNPAPDKVIGFECSIRVEDVDAAARAVEAAGGTILMPKTAIPHVGWIVKFLDTEGNLCCAVTYDASAA